MLLMVTVYARFAPGSCVPPGLTLLVIVMVGRTTVSVTFPVSAVAGLPTARALKISVSIVPDAAIPTEYVTVAVAELPPRRLGRRAPSGVAPRGIPPPRIETGVSTLPGP